MSRVGTLKDLSCWSISKVCRTLSEWTNLKAHDWAPAFFWVEYDYSLDMWSLGCMFASMVRGNLSCVLNYVELISHCLIDFPQGAIFPWPR